MLQKTKNMYKIAVWLLRKTTVVLHIVRFDVPVGLEKSGKFFTIIIAASQGRTTCMGVDCFCLFYDYWPFPEPFQPK